MAELAVSNLKIKTIQITLVGDSPLISHRFSEKNKAEMLRNKQQKKKQGRDICDPEQEFLESLYEIEGTDGAYGFPAIAFKLAAVRGAKAISDLPMTDARASFHIICDNNQQLIPLRYAELRRGEDVVRVGRGGTDLRYRGYFYNWEVDLKVQYNSAVIRPETIIELFDLAGFGTGVGDWRPENGGVYGRFHVKKGELNYNES